jgi:hypothetical protein
MFYVLEENDASDKCPEIYLGVTQMEFFSSRPDIPDTYRRKKEDYRVCDKVLR